MALALLAGSRLSGPVNPAPRASLTRRALHPAAVRLDGYPHRNREYADHGFDQGHPRADATFGTQNHGCARLMVTGRVERLMTVDVMAFHEWIVPERVVDLDRRRFEQGALAVFVGSARHNIASRLPASST